MRVPQQLAPVRSAAFETPSPPCRTRADKATRRTGPRSHATKQTKEAMPAPPRLRRATPAHILSPEQTRRSDESTPRRRCPAHHPGPRRKGVREVSTAIRVWTCGYFKIGFRSGVAVEQPDRFICPVADALRQAGIRE